MKSIKLTIIFIFFLLQITFSLADISDACNGVIDKKTLIYGWSTREPYQYTTVTRTGRLQISGMDTELLKAFAEEIGINIVSKEDSWYQTQQSIINGDVDISASATYTPERSKYSYFSKPYRSEEVSLFIIEPLAHKLNFRNINEFMTQVRLGNLHIGIIKGNVYGSQELTDFLNHEQNRDLISVYQNNMELINSLAKKNISGFISDRIVGAVNVLDQKFDQKIVEVPLGIKTPLHLMFSKKTVSLNTVEEFNKVIEKWTKSKEYQKIVKTYVYHILLPKSIDSHWCHIIGLLGGLAFTISGIIISVKRNATLLETFLLSILPSVISYVMIDVIVNSDSKHLNLHLTPSYFYYAFIVVLVNFTIIKLFSYYNKQIYEDNFLEKLLVNVLVVCDALGQATFIIIGVVVAIIKGIEPLGFWGPFCAFFTSNCGVILRDLISKNEIIKWKPRLNNMSVEISILWGIFFSILLDVYGTDPDYDTIKYSMMLSIAGAFATHLLIHYFGLSNWRFRNETTNNTEKHEE